MKLFDKLSILYEKEFKKDYEREPNKFDTFKGININSFIYRLDASFLGGDRYGGKRFEKILNAEKVEDHKVLIKIKKAIDNHTPLKVKDVYDLVYWKEYAKNIENPNCIILF